MWKVSSASGIYLKYGRDSFWCILIRLGIQTRIVKIPLFSRVFVQFTAFHASPGWYMKENLCSLAAREKCEASGRKLKALKDFPRSLLLVPRTWFGESSQKEFFNLLRTRTKEFHNFLWSIKLIRVESEKKSRKSSKRVRRRWTHKIGWIRWDYVVWNSVCRQTENFLLMIMVSLNGSPLSIPIALWATKSNPQSEPFFIRTQIGPK